MRVLVHLGAFLLPAAGLGWCATPARAQQLRCVKQDAVTATADQVIMSIRANASCPIPYLALKRAAADPASAKRIKDAYDRARRSPSGAYVGELSLLVDAAAGHPEYVIGYYDANARARSDDKSLNNASCWIRGLINADVEHAAPFCDAAVDYHRRPWALSNRAMIRLLRGDWTGAKQDYDEALASKEFRHHPMRHEALYGRGIARMRLSDEGGHEDLKAAEAERSDLPAVFADKGLVP